METHSSPHKMVRDGIFVVPKGTMLPDGWTL